MNTKKYLITRLEKSEVLKRINYELSARSENTALKKLNQMQYESRDTVDEIQEDKWESVGIISIERIG